MNIFCRADGTIFHIDTENIYQGSVGVNKIRFIGQFPSSSQVTMRCALPDGTWTNPILLTHIRDVAEVETPDGGKYSVWEGTLNYPITEHYGQVSMQFDVYSAGTGNGRLCTATATINIIKGVPIVPPEFEATDDAQELLNQILNVVSSVNQAFNNVNTELYGEGGTYDDVKGGLKKDVQSNASGVRWLYSNAGTSISFSIDGEYKLKLALKNEDGEVLGEEKEIDLPLESVVVNGRYDSDNKNVVLTLQNGNEITISVAGLISGLVSQKDFDDFKDTKGQPNGVASLNEQGIVPLDQLPPLDYLPLTGGTVDGGIRVKNEGIIVGTGEDETNYYDGGIAYGGNDFLFPEKGGTIALDDDLQILERSVDVLTNVLTEFGIWYTADDTATWNERITADGEKVLNNSLAVLEKVVGNTVACKNLLDSNLFVQGIYGDAAFSLGSTSDNKFRSFRMFLPAGTYKLCFSKEVLLARIIENGTFKSYGANLYSYTINTMGGYVGYSFRLFDGTPWDGSCLVWLTKGETDLPYEPYFKGLKSASFGGIESKNADGTETATLVFPKTPTPLGVTIDFETKKITDYGVDIVLTGSETVSYYWYINEQTNGIFINGYPKSDKPFENYVDTEGAVKLASATSGKMWCGFGDGQFYWIGILDILGYTTAGNQPTTAEEKATAIENFKAYLAQRYADGNPVTIRYVSSTLQSESNFTADNKYTAYKGGTEKVLDNDGTGYGANNELTINYVYVTEVKQ